MRILHCPTTTGGNPQGLCRAERELGIASWSLTLVQHACDYPLADEVTLKGNPFSDELRRWRAVWRALRRYDVVHFNFGSSLFDRFGQGLAITRLMARWTELADVKLARRLGRIVAVTFQGSDARQGDYCRAHYPIHFVHEPGFDLYSRKTDEHKRERIRAFDRYAHLIYAVNPDLLNVLPTRASFLPYAHVDPREWRYREAGLSDVPHVIHAPTNRVGKGTRHILEAVNRLKSEGVPFRFTLVEGLPHAEARKIYESADMVVDQLLAGFYGGLAVELMAMGRPVICYLREEDMHFLPAAMWREMPVINASPKNIYEVLKHWLTAGRAKLRRQGELSRRYVERWHDPLKIAARVKADYESAYASAR